MLVVAVALWGVVEDNDEGVTPPLFIDSLLILAGLLGIVIGGIGSMLSPR